MLTQTVTIGRLRGASIFKIILIGNALSFTLFCGIMSIPALMGFQVLKWNNQYIIGPWAILAGPVLGLVAGLMLGLVFGFSTYVGLKIFSCFQSLELEYTNPRDQVT